MSRKWIVWTLPPDWEDEYEEEGGIKWELTIAVLRVGILLVAIAFVASQLYVSML